MGENRALRRGGGRPQARPEPAPRRRGRGHRGHPGKEAVVTKARGTAGGQSRVTQVAGSGPP